MIFPILALAKQHLMEYTIQEGMKAWLMWEKAMKHLNSPLKASGNGGFSWERRDILMQRD